MNKIYLTRKDLKGKCSRDFKKGDLLIIGKYRVYIDGLFTYAEHDDNPMIKLKEYKIPTYIRDIVF